MTPEPVPRRRWQWKLLQLCFALFSFEVGAFLIAFPWMDHWNFNYFQNLSPGVEALWDSPFFRGALSGLGLVNVYISLVQVFRLLRPQA